MNPLTSKRRSELRAEAHKLSPVVLIGDKGLTDAVILETDRALMAHELIKVRAATDDREARSAWMAALCERLGAHPVQEIGKVLVIYREKPEPERAPEKKPEKKVGKKPRSPRTVERSPKTKPKTKSGALWTKKRRAPGPPKGTSRPRSPAPSPRPASGPRQRRPRTSR